MVQFIPKKGTAGYIKYMIWNTVPEINTVYVAVSIDMHKPLSFIASHSYNYT